MTPLTTFEEAAPELLQTRALLSRVDRKYLLPRRLLDDLLQALQPDYMLLRAAGAAAATYRTLYFDTADRQMFHDHRRGRCPRFKVRIRHHLERRLSFLEIKHKRHGARTTKARMAHVFGCDALDVDAEQFIAAESPYPAAALVGCVMNEFQRVTLLARSVDERVTVDWDLRLAHAGREERLPGMAIVELKQARYSNTTPAARVLRSLRVGEAAISKYCLATARLGGDRISSFKPILRVVENLSA